MKVNSQNRDISFRSFYNNKLLKQGLEFASENGALFAAGTTLCFSTVARPISIWLTPKTSKENKEVAVAKSFASSLLQFGLTFAFSLPLSTSVAKIHANPEKYLRQSSINHYKKNLSDINQSKSFNLATQLFKLGLSAAIAVPKSILTSKSMPFFIPKNKKEIEKEQTSENNINFRRKNNDNLAKGLGKILDTKGVQTFAEKFENSNFPMHIMAITDILATGSFINQTRKNKNIKEERKKALIYNSAIATTLSVVIGYIADKLTDKNTQKFIEKYKQANIKDPNLEKQILGIKIAKPILLLATIYYMIIPFVSTFLAEQIERTSKKELLT